MDTKYFVTLKTILEQGSFQKAAQKLNYTQSTVTFHMHQLEQELSVKLFERIGRRMLLTQAGKEIIPYVDTILEALRQIDGHGNNMKARGNLRVSMPETLLTYQMQPFLKAFKERAPHVTLSLQVQNCYDIWEQVLNGTVDIGIHYDVCGNTSTIASQYLADFEGALVASPAFDLKAGDFISPNQRKEISLINDGSGSAFQELFDQYLSERHIMLGNTIELWSIEAIKKSVMSNLGIAFLPRFSVENELENGQLYQIATDLDEIRISAICTWHKNKWVSPAMKLFFELLQEKLPI